jgi:hypothetical protein
MPLTAQAATSTARFTDSIGVNIHLGYNSFVGMGDNAYNRFDLVKSALDYLGVFHVRDTFAYDYYMPQVDVLAAMNIRFNVYMGTGVHVNYVGEIARIKARAAAVESVEGPNEVDNWPAIFKGQTGIAAATAEMRQLYADIHGSSALNGGGKLTPVLNFTLARPDGYAAYGEMGPYTDAGAAHIYPASGAPPAAAISAGITAAARYASNQPVVITEGGYSTLPQAGVNGSVSEQVQAKYTLSYLLDAWNAGVSRTYLYELLDEHADPAGLDREQHFGLFRFDGSAKPAAVALHNLTTLFADPGAQPGFAPGTLNLSVSGLPAATGHQLLLGKSDGSFSLVLWNETKLWDSAMQKDLVGPSVPVSIDLATPANLTLYDPLLGTTALQSWAGKNHIQLSLPDHPLILSISPVPAPTVKVWFANLDTNWAYDASLAKSAAVPAGGGTIDVGLLGLAGLKVPAHVAVSIDAHGGTTLRLVEGWDTLKTVRLLDNAGGSYRAEGFVHADALMGGTAASSITLDGVKRGIVTTGAGNDGVTVKAAAHSGNAADASNCFRIDTGAGDDQVGVQADTTGTNVIVTLGTGRDVLSLAGVQTGSIDGGAGADRIDFGIAHTAFSLILRRGEAAGDTYLNLKGTGISGGDVLDLHGYGAGAKLTVAGAGVLRVTAADGEAETIYAPGVIKLVASDYVFH